MEMDCKEYDCLEEMIETMPFVPLLKSENNYNEQVLFAIRFSRPFLSGAQAKHLRIPLKAKEIDVDKDGNPDWKKSNTNSYSLMNIPISEIMFLGGNNDEENNTISLWYYHEKEHCLQIRETLDSFIERLSAEYFLQNTFCMYIIPILSTRILSVN